MRFKELIESDMTENQRAVYREICAGPRGHLGAPTSVMLRSPELCNRVQKVGEYVRYGSSVPSRIMEFAIMITARYWKSTYVWYAHCPLAIKAGLSMEVAAQLARGQRPSGMKDDEAAAYDFCNELHLNKEVSDTTFEAAVKHFGEHGVVDLIGGSGYYTSQCMALKVNKKEAPADETAAQQMPTLGT